MRYFKANIGSPDRIFITGFSMGGHVIGAAIEMFPNVACNSGHPLADKLCRRLVEALGKLSGGVKYAGAAPFCGVMGDEALFDYFGDFGYGAQTLAGVTSQFPAPPDFFNQIFLPTINALYLNPAALLTGNGSGANVNAQGEKLRTFTTVISGGPRPLADTAFRFFQQLLFSFGGSDGTLDGVLSGNIYDNQEREYQLDADPALSAEEVAFNDTIIRIAQDPGANPLQLLRVSRVPIITGRIDIPVVSTHTTGDLFVPFVMEQIYAREAAHLGHANNLVSRATRAIGHCEFSAQELTESFNDMVSWVDTGVRPGGDDILDPAVVAAPLFGWTATRPLAPCSLDRRPTTRADPARSAASAASAVRDRVRRAEPRAPCNPRGLVRS